MGPGISTLQIVIAGSDLQQEGITRNQQIRDFRGEQETVAALLTRLVMAANPTRVTDPTDRQQKLIWVVQRRPQNSDNPNILITTRQSAQAKRYDLPAVFRSP